MSKCDQCIVRDFSALKTLTKNEVIKLADCKTTKTIKKGEMLFEEGAVIGGVFCVKDGVCKLTKLSRNGKDQIVKLVRRGELLGQRSMISEEPSNLTAVALQDMEVCFIPKTEVISFFNQNNQFSMSMMRSICGDLREADDIMVHMAQKSVRERLAYALLMLERDFGTNPNGSLQLHLTREELANMVGTATESCIRLLSEFNKSGVIEIKGKEIYVRDHAQLKRMSE